VDFIAEFEGELLRQGRSKHTVRCYLQAVKGFKRFVEEATGEEFDPERVVPLDVREYKNRLVAVEKRTPATVNARLAALATYFEFLKAKGVVKNNPAKEVEKVKSQEPLAPKTLEKNELYRLRRKVHAAGSPRDIAIFEVLYNTGIRVGELCALELDDVEISERKGQLTVRRGKGGRFRVVPLNKAAREALKSYLEVRPATDLKTPEGRILFQGERGPLTPSGVYQIIKKYAVQAGLPEVSPHTLRHQFGKELIDKGEDITRVAHLLGHASLNSTKIYTQPTEKDLLEAVEKIGTL